MKWEVDQSVGHFGWATPTKKGGSPQPLHEGRVDLHEALRRTDAVIDIWFAMLAHDAPAFSGGVWDAWPAFETEALAICKQEAKRVESFLLFESLPE